MSRWSPLLRRGSPAETSIGRRRRRSSLLRCHRAQFEHADGALMGRIPSQVTVPIATPFSPATPCPCYRWSSFRCARAAAGCGRRRSGRWRKRSLLIASRSAAGAYYRMLVCPDVWPRQGPPKTAPWVDYCFQQRSGRVRSRVNCSSPAAERRGGRAAVTRRLRSGVLQNYREVWLSAFGEVEDGLSTCVVLAEQSEVGRPRRGVVRVVPGIIAVHEYDAGAPKVTPLLQRAQATALANEEAELAGCGRIDLFQSGRR